MADAQLAVSLQWETWVLWLCSKIQRQLLVNMKHILRLVNCCKKYYYFNTTNIFTNMTKMHLYVSGWTLKYGKNGKCNKFNASRQDNCLIASFPEQSGWNGTRKVKPSWILMKQDMMGWQWHQLDHMQIICTWTDNHASTSHTHNRFTALFPGPPGWAGVRRQLLDFMVQGKINRGRHIDHPTGHHSIGLTSAHLHHPPIFYRADALSAAKPTVSKHWKQ